MNETPWKYAKNFLRKLQVEIIHLFLKLQKFYLSLREQTPIQGYIKLLGYNTM